ncbi:hypothetical protein [Embleya hyalina]|uniref:Uncharacterized protein n=1 Tax=Embleya hyalina TaxID=516124 RepID=A0A401YQW7_9ACTN|nr:hypothetical protein [Embleya hyalina]GCD96967.1 hypothetical protein EHYA_04654 [Embleya hyalina]
MGSVEVLIPAAGRVDVAGLRALDADVLARYAADPTHPWWRRGPCVRALTGRVPEHRVADLVARVRDRDEVAEVRIALLELLVERPELMPWLRDVDGRRERSYGLPEAILRARGEVGDRSAAPELATLAASAWRRRQRIGEAGLEALVARYGVEPILTDLGDRPEDRMFRVRMRHRAGADVTETLTDPDRDVAYLAQSLLSDPARLRGYLDEAPTVEAKSWAVFALHRLTGDTDETRRIHAALGHPRVEVSGLDDEVRSAIVHEYAGGCQRRSDPRWRVEALCAEPPARPDVDGQLRRATAALTRAGLAPMPPVSCGDHHRQGDGTYHVIVCDEGELLISTLGRFATGNEDHPVARRALEAAGFRWIDDATGAIRVTDLCVYHFGDREPLTVDTLLFHWQD